MSDDHLMPVYARQPLAFARGRGVWLETAGGEKFLDALSGIAVCNLGHCHPAVTRALQAQAETLVHTSNLYRIPVQEELAARLCRLSDMEAAFFCNSGAEANEAAIKLARRHGHARGIETPRIVVMENSFHGRTLGTLAATGNTKAQEGFAPLPEGFVRVPFDDVAAVEEALNHHADIVAVLVEPVQGEGGVHVPAPDYLQRLRELCDREGRLLMLDEVQTGNGRTGRFFAGAEARPDVVTTAKGLGNGFPIGVCLARGEAAQALGPGSHGTTYGGNPLGCAAAMAVLDTLEDGVLAAVAERGERLRDALEKRLAPTGLVDHVRGRGLMIGIVLDRDCADMVALARDEGLLLNVTAGNVIRLLPPLVISDEEIDILTERLGRALERFAGQQEAS